MVRFPLLVLYSIIEYVKFEISDFFKYAGFAFSRPQCCSVLDGIVSLRLGCNLFILVGGERSEV